MNRGDAIQSVTHVADVDCYPCSGLNKMTGKQAEPNATGQRMRSSGRGGGSRLEPGHQGHAG
jgi:hypothetical protein